MTVSLTGYTTATFNATVQVAFLAGIAVLGDIEPARIQLTTVTDSSFTRRRALLQTVGQMEHVESRGPSHQRNKLNALTHRLNILTS
jgi:hypothetical protein